MTREELIARNNVIAAELQSMNVEDEKYRSLDAEFNNNMRSIKMLDAAANAPKIAKTQNEQFREMLQDCVNKRQSITRDVHYRGTSVNSNFAEIAPVYIEDLIWPMEDNLIVYDKVGLKVQDAPVGTVQWPFIGSVEASINNEDASLTDTTVDLDKYTAVPNRIGITASVTYQAINSSDQDVVGIVSKQLRLGVSRMINKAMFASTNFATNFHGPAYNASNTGTFASTVPTFAELLAMKGEVAKSGADMSAFAYVMSPALYATLEATPRNAAGGDRMIIENGTLAGYPVFQTNMVNMKYADSSWSLDTVEHVMAGAWSYLALCKHGAARLVIDPVSQAKKDKVEVTLNVDMSLTNLDERDVNSKYKAFSAYTCAAAVGGGEAGGGGEGGGGGAVV